MVDVRARPSTQLKAYIRIISGNMDMQIDNAGKKMTILSSIFPQQGLLIKKSPQKMKTAVIINFRHYPLELVPGAGTVVSEGARVVRVWDFSICIYVQYRDFKFGTVMSCCG